MTMEWRALVGTGLVLALASLAGADGGKATDRDQDEPAVALASLPAPVQATLKAQAAGGKIVKVWSETEDGATSFVAKISVKTRTFEAEVAGDGSLLGTEEPVKLKDLPAAARKTVTAKLAGKKLKELEKRTEHGTSFYEFSIKGEEGETAVAADGTVMPSEAERAKAR